MPESELDDMIQKFESYLKRLGKHKACMRLAELGSACDIFDDRIRVVLDLLSKFCDDVHLVKFRISFCSKLLAYGSPMTLEFISTFGIATAYLVGQALGHRISLSTFREVLQKIAVMREVKLDKKENIVDFENPRLNEIIYLSEIYWRVLDKLGAIEHPDFPRLYAELLSHAGNRLSIERVIISVMPLFHLKFADKDAFISVLQGFSRNFDGLLGLSIVATYALISHMLHEELYLFSINAFLEALAMDPNEMLDAYEKARSGDKSLMYIILSKIVDVYYRGSISRILDAIMSDIVGVKDAINILARIPYTQATVQDLKQIFEFIIRVSEKFSGEADIGGNMLNLLMRIGSEARPAIIRNFLDSDEGRSLIIELIKRAPSKLALLAIDKLVSTFLPVETLSSSLEVKSYDEICDILDKILPNWQNKLNQKTIRYLLAK